MSTALDCRTAPLLPTTGADTLVTLVDGGTGTAVGGALLVLAALSGGATAVLCLVTLGRAVRA